MERRMCRSAWKKALILRGEKKSESEERKELSIASNGLTVPSSGYPVRP
jgi:hypothetical protein